MMIIFTFFQVIKDQGRPYLVYYLVGHRYYNIAPLPEHHEALQPVHDAGQPHRVALVHDHVGALRGEGRSGVDFDAVGVVLHLGGVIVRLIVVVLLLVGEAWMQKHSIKLIYENSRQNTNCSLTTSENVQIQHENLLLKQRKFGKNWQYLKH